MKSKSIEELENIINTVNHPVQRVAALLELSERFAMKDLLRSWMLAREAERDAMALGDKPSMAKANIDAANALWKLADFVSAQKHFQNALSLLEEDEHDLRANAHCGLGIVYGELKEYHYALSYFQKALEESEKARNTLRSANIRGNIGSVYHYLENYDLALEYFYNALKVFETLDYKSGIANMLNGIAGVKVYTGEFDEAKKCLDRYLEINMENDNRHGIATAKMNYGIMYYKKGDYLNALKHLEDAQEKADAWKIRSIKYELHKNFAMVFTDMGKSDMALEHYKRCFEIERETKRKELKQKAEIFKRSAEEK